MRWNRFEATTQVQAQGLVNAFFKEKCEMRQNKY